MDSSTKADCPFCTDDQVLFKKTKFFKIVYDKYGVSRFHMLIIPLRHVETLDQLTEEEYVHLMWYAKETGKWIMHASRMSGVNIGLNWGKSAGQTIDHFHLHVIGREEGDVEDPVGGVRNVIPGMGNYLSAEEEDERD